jgi:outer membrane protein assembly factor BamA
LDPPVPGLRLDAVEGTELDARGAQEIAGRIRTQLQESGYPDAEVRAELRPTAPGKGDLSSRVARGRSLEMRRAAFEGGLGFEVSELRKAPHAAPARTPEAGAASLQSFYYQHGYFNLRVRAVAVEPHGNKLRVRFEVHSGPQLEGGFQARALCRELSAEQRQAEQAVIIEFRGTLRAEDATAAVERGPGYEVGRIEFRGNHTVRDATIRRALLLDEGAPFDQGLLRRSLARLNRTGLFEPLGEDSLTVNTPPGTRRQERAAPT